MKEHMISYSPTEFVGNSSAQFHSLLQTDAAPGSPHGRLDGNTGSSNNRLSNKGRKAVTNFRVSHLARVFLSIVLVGLLSVAALAAPTAPGQISDDLKEGLESHNAGTVERSCRDLYRSIGEESAVSGSLELAGHGL